MFKSIIKKIFNSIDSLKKETKKMSGHSLEDVCAFISTNFNVKKHHTAEITNSTYFIIEDICTIRISDHLAFKGSNDLIIVSSYNNDEFIVYFKESTFPTVFCYNELCQFIKHFVIIKKNISEAKAAIDASTALIKAKKASEQKELSKIISNNTSDLSIDTTNSYDSWEYRAEHYDAFVENVLKPYYQTKSIDFDSLNMISKKRFNALFTEPCNLSVAQIFDKIEQNKKKKPGKSNAQYAYNVWQSIHNVNAEKKTLISRHLNILN